MDPAIRKMQEKVDMLLGDESQLRAYLRYEKAASDEVTRINGAKREGRIEGRVEGRAEGRAEGRIEGRVEGRTEEAQEIARNFKAMGIPFEQIAQGTGLTEEQIKEL